MRIRYQLALAGIVSLVGIFSLLAQERQVSGDIPPIGRPIPISKVVLWSGEERLAEVNLTNGARPHLPPEGKFHLAQGPGDFVYEGEGVLTLEIESTNGHSIKLLAERIQVLLPKDGSSHN